MDNFASPEEVDAWMESGTFAEMRFRPVPGRWYVWFRRAVTMRFFVEDPMQRAMRDTQVMSAHVVADWDAGRESYSRALLGLPIEPPVFWTVFKAREALHVPSVLQLSLGASKRSGNPHLRGTKGPVGD